MVETSHPSRDRVASHESADSDALGARGSTTAPQTPDMSAAIHDTTTSNANTAPASPSLLRNWDLQSRTNSENSMTSPPVAPAVVMEEQERLGSSATATYPVATFVRDWVRTSIDHIGQRASGSGSEQHHHHHPHHHRIGGSEGNDVGGNGNDDESAMLPLSVRSEADISHVRPRAMLNEYHSAPQMDPSRRQVSDIDQNEHEEYILVDGDLIALPKQAPNALEQELMEDLVRSQIERNSELAKSCQPRRVRRGVRKLSKLFKRGKRGSKESATSTVQSGDTLSNRTWDGVSGMHNSGELAVDLSGMEPAAFAGAVTLLDQGAAATTSATVDEGSKKPAATTKSPKRKSKDKSEKKNRWGIGRRSLKAAPMDPDDYASARSHESAASRESDDNTDSMALGSDLLRGGADSSGLYGMGLAPPATDRSEFASAAAPYDQDGLVYTSRNGLAPTSRNGYASMPPPMRPINESGSGGSRTHSATASYVGPEDQILHADTLPDTSVIIEHDPFDAASNKKDDTEQYLPLSLVAEQADLKVDKADTPDVEAMLHRALIDATELEAPVDSDSIPSDLPLPPHLRPSGDQDTETGKMGKSDEVSLPLSQAGPQDTEVHNDVLKVIMVSASAVEKSWLSRLLRNSTKRRPRKRTTLAVDVHEWRPYLPSETASASQEPRRSPVKCTIWDVQGASASKEESRSNFGAHPGTQSLFFSPNSLYLLCWDLAVHNIKAKRRERSRDFDDDDSDSEDEDDMFADEEANRQADRALHADITHRVLSWYNCIAQRGPKSAILPVALIPEGMSKNEVDRRCTMMHSLLAEHVPKFEHLPHAPKLLTGTEDGILHVKLFSDGEGIQQLQEMIVAIANDPSRSVFDHVGTLVPAGTVLIRDALNKLKEQHKLILVDHLLGALGNSMDICLVQESLHFLASIGEILYFGTPDDEVLSRYIILSRKWLVSALSCILRNDLKRELTETRRFMNMQCIYSDQQFTDNEVTKALLSGTISSCPLLSDRDAQMLWQSMSFMREASDRYANIVENSTTAPTMFYFLERLLVHSGIFLPLGASQQNASLDQSEVFFVPSLLAKADPQNMWTYMSSDAWTTTLCHSWLFRDGAPPGLLEHLTVTLLSDLYSFSRQFSSGPPNMPSREAPHRASSVPVGTDALGKFMEGHEQTTVGRVRIHHIVCFQSSILIKIGTVFTDNKTGDLRESFVEVFVAIVDQSSTHSVASDVMRPSMQRVIVSGKGQAGHHGRKLWKGGYKVILDCVRTFFQNMPNVDSQVICPECLATSSPRIASTWGWDSVLAVAESGNPHVICLRGHRVNSTLICGTGSDRKSPPGPLPPANPIKSIKETLPSVVLVGLWDPESKSIISVGSGFIVDKKVGLIVTAGHVFFNMKGDHEKKHYFGHRNAKAVVGVIPDAAESGKQAVFRYFADVVAQDVQNVDACVLQIRARMECDVSEKDGASSIALNEQKLSLAEIANEQLKSIKLTKHFELEESVRLIGYNQGGEGIHEKGEHISHAVDFVGGYICRHFKSAVHIDSFSSDSDSTSSHQDFAPKEEIVVMGSTISGHSGGPCVNKDGKVVGILSRSDPSERQRCYVVPATEIKPLVMKAKSFCMRPARITSAQTM